MAEGGYEKIVNDPDDLHDDNNGNDDEVTSLIPRGSSTPAPVGEEIEMQTMSHEQSGMPQTSYTETSFGAQSQSEKAWTAARKLFPNMSSTELEVFYNSKGKLQVKMFGSGKKSYDIFTTKRVQDNSR